MSRALRIVRRAGTLTLVLAATAAVGALLPTRSSAADAPAAAAATSTSDSAAKPAESDADKKFPAWDTVIKDHKKLEGFFDLYYNEKDQSLLMEIKADQFDKDLISPIAIARGAGFWFLGGDTLNFGDQWVLNFRRAANNLHVVRKNVYYKANSGSPQADALETSYTDSVVLAVPIKSEQGKNVLIDLADLYMTDFAHLGVSPDRARSTWGKVKSFAGNVEIEVNAVFPLSYFGFLLFLGQDERKYLEGDIPDSRGAQVTIHYGLSKLPADNGYQPRLADDRVGHFLSVVKDYSTDAEKTPFQRYVTRWHLEKADDKADKSAPKEPILFWIEKSVPREYRTYVKEGILEWNKAFEKIGFIDAIQVRDQQSSDDFDPEDIRYNTFRWITTSSAFAMGPSRTNPLTGQILDADILFDEAMVRYWRQQYLRWAGLPQGLDLLAAGQRQAWFKLYAADMPKLARHETALNRYAQSPDGLTALVRPRQQVGGSPLLRSPLAACQCCSMGPGITRQLGFMAAIMQAQGKVPLGGKIPQEYIGQAIKEVTMHEVGHTLGLRHNFKASNMLSLEDCNNTEITSKKGMAGSVMDYLPANIARKGQPQGHFFSPTIGPYDFWAIEYAYKPISGDEDEELKKIASRVAEPDLIFGTDEDMFASPDPRINVYDLGDPLTYARQRLALVEENLQELADRVVAEGEGWQRAREAFNLLLSEYAQSTYLAAQYVGSEYT
ncbi:MAG: zinc-dependent metalloprotease, partial [Pirellulales bacterium]